MKTATIRDLRYRFGEIERRLRQGEEIEIRRRQRPIAKLVPLQPSSGYPDFAVVQRQIFGRRKRKMMDGRELAALNRGER
jgi:antitoxin (DNA-binding transcriptional repressor) of toxin-antitoxin stability system